MTEAAGGPWVPPRRPERAERARVRLFCLPYAGGGAGLFHRLGRALPDWIEVVPVLLPGRDRRLREAPRREAHGLADELADGLAPHLEEGGLPFALLGHSMGALLAFELERRLARRGAPAPAHVFAAAFRAPHLPERNPTLHTLTDAELAAALGRLGGTPPEVLAHAELMRLVLPVLRADLELVETYRWREGPRCRAALTALGSSEDPLVGEAELAAWREVTDGPFRLRLVPGGHFFLERAADELRAEVAATLGAALGR